MTLFSQKLTGVAMAVNASYTAIIGKTKSKLQHGHPMFSFQLTSKGSRQQIDDSYNRRQCSNQKPNNSQELLL